MINRPLPLLLLALLPLFASGAPDAGIAGKALPGEGGKEITAGEYRQGLVKLRGYLEKRGEDSAAAEGFILAMELAFPGAPSERVPVTKDVFSAFLRYQAAWARKTRDSKNPNVTENQLKEEVSRATRLKEIFRTEAAMNSPRFYGAFQASVKELRLARRDYGKAYGGNSAVFFGDQVDDSYTHVDAGDVALENGDTAKAISEADRALQVNPENADAFVLRAGSEYERGNTDAAIRDARSALRLDPGNQQARAIVSLSGEDSVKAAAAGAVADGARIDRDGRAVLPELQLPAAERAAALPGSRGPARLERGSLSLPLAAPSGLRPPPPPTSTPAVGALLSRDLTARAVQSARADAFSSIEQLDQALTLNPRNANAQSWRATISNRVGDYGAALASAQESLIGAPDDAVAYFNKAYALAGKKDRKGTVEALEQAARIDPSYKPILDQAQMMLPGADDMELLFSGSAAQHEPAAPPTRPRRFPLPLVALGAIGALLILAAGVQLLRPGRSIGR